MPKAIGQCGDKPLRYGLSKTARLLDMTPMGLRKLIDSDRNPFTVSRPNGKGAGQRAFIPADEVHAYATSADPVAAVRAVQIAQGRPVIIDPPQPEAVANRRAARPSGFKKAGAL